MKQKLLILTIIISSFLLLSSCTNQLKCNELANNLDNKIIDTNNPPGRLIISEYE